MALKKKTIAAGGSYRAAPPVPARTGDVADTGGGGDQDRPRHLDTRSHASGVVHNIDDGPHIAAPKVELRYLRVARGSPRVERRPRQCPRCGPLSSCMMKGAVMLMTPGIAVAKALSVTLKTGRADMHAMMLARKAHGHGIMMELLLM